jgi:hypothetical protein
MEKLKLLLGSRKFWAAIVGLALMLVKAWKPEFPLEEEQVTGIVVLLVSFILGTAVEDGLRNM